MHARLTLSTLPPLPYAAALRGILSYPYGCIEQTTSKGYAALILDGQTAKALGATAMTDAARKAAVEAALARIASFQASNGHFSFWGGSSPIETFITPYVVDFMLDARDGGFVVPQDVLQKSLQRLNDDLLAGGHPYYGYEQPSTCAWPTRRTPASCWRASTARRWAPCARSSTTSAASWWRRCRWCIWPSPSS